MKFFAFALTMFLCSNVFSQDFQNQFAEACQDYDSIKQLQILEEWEKVNADDPELFASYFNYHFIKSKTEVIEMTTEEPNGEALAIIDSSENIASFMVSGIMYEENDLKKAFDKIESGIAKYPNRLDLRFGKIYACGEAELWDEFASEIVKAVDHSMTNDNKWLWTNNEKTPGEDGFLLSVIQDYQLQIYNTQDDELLVHMKTIANGILNHYPDHIESLSNLSIVHTVSEEYEEALIPLLKAEKIAPEDHIILANIANVYKNLDNKKQAIKYFEKLLEFDNEGLVNYAKESIAELKKG